MRNLSKYPVQISGILVIVLIAGYALFEISISSSNKSAEGYQQTINNSLDEGVSLFNSLAEELEQTASEVTELLERGLSGDQNRSAIYNHLPATNLWGITIYLNDEKWLWKDFVIRPPAEPAEEPSSTYTANLNNNVHLLVNRTVLEYDDNVYTVLTAKRLAQTTDLPFIKNADYSLSNELSERGHYPVYFNFFGTVPANSKKKPLLLAYSDSVGTVWATIEDSDNFALSREETRNRWRFFFQLSSLIAFFLFAGIISGTKEHLAAKIIPFLILLIAWPLLLLSGILEYWIDLFFLQNGNIDANTLNELVFYITNSLFLFLFFLSVHNILRYTQKPRRNDKHYRTFAFSVLFGILNVIVLLFFLLSTQNLLVNSAIPLLDLELAPDVLSFIFYIFSGLFFVAAAGICVATGYYIYISEEDKSAIIAVISGFSFLLGYFFADLYVQFNLFEAPLFWLAFAIFVVSLFIIHFLHKYPESFSDMSGFRKLMLMIFIASIAIYVIISNTVNSRIDRDLLTEVHAFIEEEGIGTSEILFQLLSNAEQQFLEHSDLSPDEQKQIIQTQFQRTIQNNIQDDWKNHSFNIRLLATDDTELTSYSTSLETPLWSSYYYNTDTMLRAYRGEQIRWQTNRPIIWRGPVNLSDQYTSFDRGWIPLYNSTQGNTIVLWIAGDVYKERLDYNKPLRAVLSAATNNDWRQSFYIAEYLGDRLIKSTINGIYQNQPQYNRLPRREAEIAATDSISFITNITSDGSFREVLVQSGQRSIIKASTPVPGFNHHLFSFFRMQIVLIFFGLFCFSILAMLGFRHYSLFGQNRKFKDRLVDGLSLATIMFLTVLIFATQYAIGIQNEKNVERDLIQSLNGISEAIKQLNVFSDDFDTSDLLSGITAPLNADLVFFKGSLVEASTTPQIFQQYLLPATISYPAYDFLFNRERTHYIATANIGNNEMVIGYRSLPDTYGFPAGAIAIPTFLQSPVHNEQLLETTSYLFAVYLFIFVLFIGGSVFLSNQLTRPLKVIQSGLNKISRGDMKTKVAVTSRDEIGSLALAYNNMVQRLDYAQKELMKAERESAWKEMAQQVAHEIKNPLTPMKLSLQHLQLRLESNPEKASELKAVIEKTTTNIIEQIESLNKIASDFSKFAKPIHGSKTNIDLVTLIKSVSELYEHEVSATISLTLPKNELIVPAVEDELRRALINLVKNALEAAQNGEVKIQVRLKKLREHAMIHVKDNGMGIVEADREKIFLPKFSTKSSGTGLGLAITKKIIEAHDGDIWFESRPGQGSSFYIRLPIE